MRALTQRTARAGVVALVSWSFVVGGSTASVPSPMSEEGEQRPNLLVIMTDDQRLETMRVMPKTRKWFKRQGRSFPNAFVTTPLCCPSRATVFTGRYGHNHGVRSNRDGALLDQRSTVQRQLRDAGYLTALAGKYFNGWPIDIPPPHFDRWAVSNGRYVGAWYNVNGKVRKVDGYTTDFAASRAERFLRWFERRDDAPWLLFVQPFAPHGPFDPARRHRKARVPRWRPTPSVREADRSDKPPEVQSRSASISSARRIRRQQLRTLMAVDDLVGRLMSELGGLGERRNTLAVFTSDNGFFWAEHGLGDKRFPYMPAIRVPMFLRWPGRIPSGVDRRLVANVDLMPTIMAAAGVQPDPRYPVDGRSLLGGHERDHLIFEYWKDIAPKAPDWASYLDRGRQYTEYYDLSGEVVFREYYDLVNDPFQLRNILGDDDARNDPNPLQLVRLRGQLSQGRSCSGTVGESACP